MMRWPAAVRYLLFALVLVASSQVHEGQKIAITQAVIWLPTGVGIAGLWLLGVRHWWIVLLSTLIQRFILGYPVVNALPGALGSTAEAVLGVIVLRRLGLRNEFSGLRDALAIFAAAAVAPLGSILCSWIARLLITDYLVKPFYSGWDGWWRMNALGVLTIVPLAVTWSDASSQTFGTAGRVWTTAASTAAGLGVLMLIAPEGEMGIVILNLVLPVTLYSAFRFGPRGAATAGALSAIAAAISTAHGFGPFIAVPIEQRHEALQFFELTLVAIPLLFGALVAEREAERTRGVQTEVLRRSTERALPDITCRIREDGACTELHVPEGVGRPTPYDPLVGRSIHEFLGRESAEVFALAIRQVLGQGNPVTVEYGLEVGGKKRVHEARCVPYGATEILAVVRDITDRKLAERTAAFETRILELVATGRPTGEVFTAIASGIEELSGDGNCSIAVRRGDFLHVVTAPSLPVDFNAAVGVIGIGPTAGSCGTAAFRGEIVVVEDIAANPLWDSYRAAAESAGLKACWSVPVHGSDGMVLGTFAIYSRQPRRPLPYELKLAEKAAALAGIVIDRERHSEALRHSEGLLASISQNVSEGLYRITPDRRLVYANAAFARMFGFESTEEALRQTAFHEQDDSICHVVRRRLDESNGHLSGEECRFRRRDGSTFWALVSGTAVRNEEGAVTHFDGAVTDITGRKELEEQFRQSQKMEAVGKLAGGIAHDFNNLLTAIFGYTDSIRRATPPASGIRMDAEEIRSSAERAAGLTRQLLAYSRQQVLSPQVLDIANVVDQLGEMLRRLIGEDILLTIRNTTDEARVRVDRSQLEQVILNLALNSRDAMPAGGELHLTTTCMEVDGNLARSLTEISPGPYVVLSVRDNGFGMTPEVQKRAFDPFFTTKDVGKGTGLGLSTVYGIVKQSGGAIWLDSKPGAGTTAWIYFPRVLEAAEPERASPAAPPRTGHATILVVEDEAIVRRMVRKTLSVAGYTVLEATDGAEALLLSRSHSGRIDMVITDVVMPEMGGTEMADILQTERPGIPALLMSGYTNEAPDLRDFRGSRREFIQKPFNPEALVDRVARLIRGSRTGR